MSSDGRGVAGEVIVTVSPSTVSLADDPVKISVSGLTDHQLVTVAAVVIEDGNKFVSCGHFVADQNGLVELDKATSIGGTYTGFVSNVITTSTLSGDYKAKLRTICS